MSSLAERAKQAQLLRQSQALVKMGKPDKMDIVKKEYYLIHNNQIVDKVKKPNIIKAVHTFAKRHKLNNVFLDVANHKGVVKKYYVQDGVIKRFNF